MKIKVLFVCMGNICRSPTAEGIFTNIVKQQNLSANFIIDSAGTHPYNVGNAPDIRSQQTAMQNGIDLSKQKARQVDESDFYYYDYIIAMDESNLQILTDICPQGLHHKLSLLLENYPDTKNLNVPDPYCKNNFTKVFNMVQTSCINLLQKLQKDHFN